ncbi:hypothetical protein [Mucilaginibacter boryungensis]|uniref:Lipocalin-like domain-containing protein n=1 Tax=Mucilaginibacter boryungensis TaxID=768480 RepID=A0ABR9XD87_9SPHI|nr:hypothetical protein [Mucilaginibacter boryungensis]MBE9665358.1 hypothetical protein [Mucilaginibacter boryungensis]
MKKIVILCLFSLTFAACKKAPVTTPALQTGNGITGKWNIISVTVIPRDSTGKAINNGTGYAEPAYYFFQFNADNTWVENLDPAPTNPLGESGRYVLHADTSFTLINVNLPSSPVECKIVSLSGSSFVFSHQKATLYNGVTPGRLEYVFELKK